MTLAILYSSKGKATQEISETLIYYANKHKGCKAQEIRITSEKDIEGALKLIKTCNAVAIGSPTYDNGKPMQQIVDLFKSMDKNHITLKGKNVMLYGAYTWGFCESVDYLLKECIRLQAKVYKEEHIDGKPGLRLNTSEILDDSIPAKYVDSFLKSCGIENLSTQQNAYSNPPPVIKEDTNQKIQSYRTRIKSEDLNNRVFENCRFIRTDFSGKQQIENTVFRNCIFWYSSFDGSSISDTVFENCDMSDCSFRHTSLIRTTLTKCDLTESKLYMCDLLMADFESVKMEDVSFLENLSSDQQKRCKGKHKMHCKEKMIEKHEIERNYSGAVKTQKKLYLNAKQLNESDLAEVFYFRMMENTRKLCFRQSIFYRIWHYFILTISKVLKCCHLTRLANSTHELSIRSETQVSQNNHSDKTIKYFLLLLLKIVTGNKNSIARLAGFATSVIFISSIVLFILSFDSSIKYTPIVFLRSYVHSLRVALFFVFNLSSEKAPQSGSLANLVYYADSVLRVVIGAFFGYILIEKLDK